MKNHTLGMFTLVHQELQNHVTDAETLLTHYDDGKSRTLNAARTTASEHIDNVIESLKQLQNDITKLPMQVLIVKHDILSETED